MGNPFKSVGMKLFIIFFVCIVSMVLVLGLISSNQAASIIQDKVSNSTEQTILLASQKLEDKLQTYQDMTMQVLMDKDISSRLVTYTDPNADQFAKMTAYSDLTSKFSALAANRNDIRSIMFINPKTGDMIGTGGIVDKDTLMKQPWVKATIDRLGAPVWLPTLPKGYVGEPTTPAFAVTRFLRDTATGSDLGIVMITVKESALDDQLGKLVLGDDSPVVMVGSDNEFLRSVKDEELGTSFADAARITKEEKDATVESGLAKAKTSGGNLIVYKEMELTGWTIVGSTPIKDLVKETSKIDTVMWILVASAALVAIIVGLLIVRMIGTPLIGLRNLMREGAQGTLTVRTKIRRQDEIGQLADSFNIMMEQITKLVEQTTNSAAEVMATSGTLLQASKQTAVSAREIAVATEEIAGGASSLAVEAERGNSITHEISMQMREVIQANEEMEHAAHEVQQVSERGTSYMSELSLKTGASEQMVRAMVDKVNRLKESTFSIRKVLDMLNNMTKQTNILSLNATIEAARAGTAGKGFMVVADEIRKLAEQSKQSIEVVGQITDSIQKEVDETVKTLSDAYPVFQEQIEAVKEAELIFTQVRGQMGGLSERLNGVSESVQRLEQSQTTLTDAMANVSAVAEESSATSQEVASLSSEQTNISQGLVKLSESLETLSVSLQEQLSKFKI